ncbi:MAG: hypothetical protein C4530_05665 [Desulfobacteraceae bacterium]|nr:MAG: hypothetical protein C4530_05665 [Desulfobacteraceae bacterium]
MNRWIPLFFLCCIVAFGFAGSALAAGEASSWRETYDWVMRWINFFILAALIVKFAKTPLRDFISVHREKLVRDLKKKEEEKERAIQEINLVFEQTRTSRTRLEELRNRIIEQGKKKRQELIDEARQESRYKMTSVRERIAHQILNAELRVKADLVESAFEHVWQRLPGVITEDDNQRLVGQFLSDTESR